MPIKPGEQGPRRSARPVTGRSDKSRGDELDSGLVLLVDIFKRKRRRRKISLFSLAKRARVPVGVIKQLESYRLNSVGLQDLLAIGTALGSKLTVALTPVRPKLPKTNAEALSLFDALIKTPDCNSFMRTELDKEHQDLRWDIVGDKRRNWLIVVVTNRKTKLRFAKVTDEPGGWSIAGQVFGIDAETNAIAEELSDQLYRAHRTELDASLESRTGNRVTD